MKKETLNILNDRLKKLNCLHSQPWLRARLMAIIGKEWVKINAQALQKLRRVVNLKITHKTIGNEFLSGPPVDFAENEIKDTKTTKTEATAKPTDAKSASNTEPSTKSEKADESDFSWISGWNAST